MLVTLGVLRRIVKWRAIERQLEGKSSGYFALDNINGISEVGYFSARFSDHSTISLLVMIPPLRSSEGRYVQGPGEYPCFLYIWH